MINPIHELDTREAALLKERGMQQASVPNIIRNPARLAEIETELETIASERSKWQDAEALEKEIQRRTEALQDAYRDSLKILEKKHKRITRELCGIKLKRGEFLRELEPEFSASQHVAGHLKCEGLTVDHVAAVRREFNLPGVP